MTPRIIRLMDSRRPSWVLIMARMASSIMKGAHRATAKGQPRMPPTANHQMPEDVLSPPRQFMNAAAPRRDVYMAKLEGRKAVAAWKLPGERMVARMKRRPTRGFSVKLTTRNRRTWHRAQPKASTYRTK